MDKLLFFKHSDPYAFAVPDSRVIRMLGGSGNVTIFLDSASRVGDPQQVVLTCEVDEEKKVIDDINNSIKNSRDPIIVIADNVKGSYVSNKITSLTTTGVTLYA